MEDRIRIKSSGDAVEPGFEWALQEAFEKSNRARIGLQARGLRFALKVWLDTVTQAAGEVAELLEQLEAWGAGGPHPTSADAIVARFLGRPDRGPDPHMPLGSIAFDLAVDAAIAQSPALGRALKGSEGGYVPPALQQARSIIANELASQAEHGVHAPDGLYDRMIRAVVAALTDSGSVGHGGDCGRGGGEVSAGAPS